MDKCVYDVHPMIQHFVNDVSFLMVLHESAVGGHTHLCHQQYKYSNSANFKGENNAGAFQRKAQKLGIEIHCKGKRYNYPCV